MNPRIMESARNELTKDELAKLRELLELDRKASRLGYVAVPAETA